MRPLYTEAEFKAAKSRDPLPLSCQRCHSPFPLPKNQILSAIKPGSKQTADYCSPNCRNIAQRNRPKTICAQCLQEFDRKPSRVTPSKSGLNFCSRSCSATYNNLHKKHGTRRSKLEKWLEEQLPALYPSLEFHFNRKDAIESELDIFIPSLRLAFELNGIYHYEPIHGQDKLDSVQSNDKRKFAACHEAGISLCVIDNSSMKNFKEQRAMKFLTIIRDIIDAQPSDS